MNEEYLKKLHSHLEVRDDYETWISAVKDNEEYLRGLHKHIGVTDTYENWNKSVFGGVKKKDSSQGLDGDGSTSNLEAGNLVSQNAENNNDPEIVENKNEEEDLTITKEDLQPKYTLQGQNVSKRTLEAMSQSPGFEALDWSVENDDSFKNQLTDSKNQMIANIESKKPSSDDSMYVDNLVSPESRAESRSVDFEDHTYKEIEGGEESYGLTPDGLEDTMVNISEEFPELKNLPSLTYTSGTKKGKNKEYNPHLVHPKVSHFLKDLKDVYSKEKGEDAWTNLDLSSLFRHSDHFENQDEHSLHKHGLAVDVKGESGKELMDFLVNHPDGQAIAEKWGAGGNMGNGIHDEYDTDAPHLHFQLKRGDITVRRENKKLNVTSTNPDDIKKVNNFIKKSTVTAYPNINTNPGEYNKSVQNKLNDISSKLNSKSESYITYDPSGNIKSERGVYSPEWEEKINSIKEEIENVKALKREKARFQTSKGRLKANIKFDKEIEKLQEKLEKTIESAEKEPIAYSEKIGISPEEINAAYQNNSNYNYMNDPVHKIPEYIKDDEYMQNIYAKRQDFPFLGGEMNNRLTDVWINDYLLELERANPENKIEDVNFLKEQINKGFSYIGNNEWLHLETGLVLGPTSKHNANPLVSDGGARVDIVESIAKDPNYLSGLDKNSVEKLYSKYFPKKSKEHKSRIKYYTETSKQSDLKKWKKRGSVDISHEDMIEVAKGDYIQDQYNFLNPILADLNKGVFNQLNESDIVSKIDDLTIKRKDGEEWINKQMELMLKRYPSTVDSDGVLIVDESRMSQDDINAYNKDVNDLNKMNQDVQDIVRQHNELTGTELVRTARYLSETYDKIEAQANGQLTVLEARQKLVNNQIDEQIKRDEKYRDSFDKGGFAGSVGGFIQRAWWMGGDVVEKSWRGLINGMMQMPQLISESIDEIDEYSEEDMDDAFGFVDDIAEIGANHFESRGWFGGLTRYNTGWRYDRAVVDGVNLVIKDGEVVNMYDEDYVMIDPRSFRANKLREKYYKNIENYPEEEESNTGAFVMMGVQSLADLIVDARMATTMSRLGKAKRVSQGLHLGVMYGNYVARTYNGYIQDYLSKIPNATMEEAQDYARTTGMTAGITQFISPNFGIWNKIPVNFSTRAYRNFMLGGFSKSQMFAANMSHNLKRVLIPGVKESGQEVLELESVRGTNFVFYKDKNLTEERSEMTNEYIQSGVLGLAVGGSGNIRNARNPFNFNKSRFQQEALVYAYKNQKDMYENIMKSVGSEIFYDGDTQKLTKEGAEEIIEKHKNLFQSVDNLKTEAKDNGVNLDESADYALINLLHNKSEIEGYQNSTKIDFRNLVRDRLQTIDNQIQRIIQGEDAYDVLNEDSNKEFEDLGVKADNLTLGEKTIFRKLKNKAEWSNEEVKWSKRGLKKAIRELDSKEELTLEEQQKKNALQEMLNQVNNIKPTINEKSNRVAEKIANKIDGSTFMDESQDEGDTKTSEVQSIRTPKGKVGRKINPLSPSARISDAIGKNVEYKGKKGVLERDKDGNFIIKTPGRGRNIIIKEAKRPNMQLRTAGIKATGTPFTITKDGTISMEGQPDTKVVAFNKDSNGNLESLIVTDPDIGEKTGKVLNSDQIKRAKNKIQKLQNQLRNNDITQKQYNEAISKIKGIRTVSFPDLQLDIAAEQMINEILDMNPDFSTVTMQDFDNIIEEEMSEYRSSVEKNKFSEDQKKKQEKAREKALKQKGEKFTNTKEDIKKLKRRAGAYLSQSNNPFANLKGRVLRQVYDLFIPLGYDVVVHKNSDSMYNGLRKIINPETGQPFTHVEAARRMHSKGFIMGADGEIHVNLNTAQDNTLFHESSHPFVKSLIIRKNAENGKGPLTDFFNKVENELKDKDKSLRDNGRGTYWDFGLLYAKYDKDGNITNKDKVIEEALAEYLADAGAKEYNRKHGLSSIGESLHTIDRARNFIKSILEFFGMKSSKPFELNYEDIITLGGIKSAYTTTIPKGKQIDIDQEYRGEPKTELEPEPEPIKKTGKAAQEYNVGDIIFDVIPIGGKNRKYKVIKKLKKETILEVIDGLPQSSTDISFATKNYQNIYNKIYGKNFKGKVPELMSIPSTSRLRFTLDTKPPKKETQKQKVETVLKDDNIFPYVDPVTKKEINKEDLINLNDFQLVREISFKRKGNELVRDDKKTKKGKLYRKIRGLEKAGKPDMSKYVPEGGMYYYDPTGTLREVGKKYGYMPGLSATNSLFEDVKGSEPDFQLDESNYSNTIDAINNSTIMSGNPTQWINELNRVSLNPKNLKEDMDYLGFVDFLNTAKEMYTDQMIPREDLVNWVGINKTRIEAISENEIRVLNQFTTLGDVKFKEVIDDDGNKTMLVNDIVMDDGLIAGNTEPLIRRLIRYSSDLGYNNISFKTNEFKNQMFNEIISDSAGNVVSSIDPSAGPVLNDVNGEPLVSIQMTPKLVTKSTIINSPSFQMDDSSIPVDRQFQLKIGNSNIHTDFPSRYLRSDRGMPAMLQAQLEMQGKIKVGKLKAAALKKKMEKLIKGQKDFTKKQINEALQDPTKKIKKLEREISFLEDQKSSMSRAAKKLKGVGAEIDAKIEKLKERILSVNKEYGGKTKLSDIEAVNRPLHDALVEARELVDELSKSLIGVTQGEMQATIQENLGLYIMKQYRAHHDQKYARRIRKQYEDSRLRKAARFVLGNRIVPERTVKELLNQQGVLGKAVKYIHDQLQKQNPNEVITADAVVTRLNELLGNKKTDFMGGVVATNKIKEHVLKRRKDIPEPISDLLNEIHNPTTNFSRTVTQMVGTLESRNYQNKIVDFYLGSKILVEGYVKNKTTGERVTSNEKLQEKIIIGDKVYFTDKFTKSQILGYQEIPNKMFRSYMRLLSWVKMGKTIYSPATHLRNFQSNFGFAVMNGHINPYKLGQSIRIASQVFGESTNTERRDLFREMVEVGIIDDVADIGELQDMLRAGGTEVFEDDDFEPGHESGKKWHNKILKYPEKLRKKIHNGAVTMYLFEDAYWKVNGFLHEVDRYQKAGLSRQDALKEAGNIIRNAYPTYSMVPEAIRALKVSPLVGTFVSYPYEVIRTQIMTFKQIKKELSSSNEKIKEIGVKRLVGTTAWHIGFPIAATAFFKAAANFGQMIFQGIAGDDEDDKKALYDPDMMQDSEMADLLRFVGPNWHKNSQVIPIQEVSPGVLYYWAINDNNSHGYFTKVGNSILNRQGDDPFWGADDWAIIFNDPTVIAVLEPFLGEDILARNIREILTGEKGSGAPLYQDADEFHEKIPKALEHLWKGARPSVINNAIRIWESHNPSPEDGQKYDPTLEWSALMGLRVSKIDLEESYKYKMMAVNRYINNLTVKEEDGKFKFKTPNAKKKILRMLEFADNYTEAVHDLGIEKMTVVDEKTNIPDSNYGADWKNSNLIKYMILKNIYAKPGLIDILTRDKSVVHGFPNVNEVLEWTLKDRQREALKEKELEER